MTDGDDVVVRPLACDDIVKISSTMLLTAGEGHRLLSEATAPWKLGAEIQTAIQQLIPLILIDASGPGPSLEDDEIARFGGRVGHTTRDVGRPGISHVRLAWSSRNKHLGRAPEQAQASHHASPNPQLDSGERAVGRGG